MSEEILEVPELSREQSLAGRAAIVTGAGSAGEMAGTGAAISIVLAARGASVTLIDIDEARAAHTKEAIDRIGGTAQVVVIDLTDPEQCKAAVQATVDAYGSVDIVVNNAAIAPQEDEFDFDLWNRIIALNLTAPMLMIAAALPEMRKTGNGSIVNISSVSSLEAGGGTAYTAAKAGLSSLGRALALREGPNGIRVNDVAPGHVAIPMGLGFKGWSGDLTAGDATRRRRAHATLLGTEGTGWDIATAVAFMAGDDSRYITGVTLPVDGGTTKVFPLVMWSRINERDAAADAAIAAQAKG
jgi:NAD(P)-dependent dehydrogenase (short-subunit alcohol dehydrogenase family)